MSITAAAIWSSRSTDPPPAEPKARRDRDQPPLAGVGEHLKGQSRPAGVERREPELVDRERPGPSNERGLAVELPVAAGATQAHDEGEGGEEARLEPLLAGHGAWRRGHVDLAGPDVAHGHQVLPAVEEVECEQRLVPQSAAS